MRTGYPEKLKAGARLPARAAARRMGGKPCERPADPTLGLMRGGRIVLIRGGQIVLMPLATDAIDRRTEALC